MGRLRTQVVKQNDFRIASSLCKSNVLLKRVPYEEEVYNPLKSIVSKRGGREKGGM